PKIPAARVPAIQTFPARTDVLESRSSAAAAPGQSQATSRPVAAPSGPKLGRLRPELVRLRPGRAQAPRQSHRLKDAQLARESGSTPGHSRAMEATRRRAN